MAIWSRKVRESRTRTRRVTNSFNAHEREFKERAARVDRATSRAERAAIALLTSDDEIMRAVARGRK